MSLKTYGDIRPGNLVIWFDTGGTNDVKEAYLVVAVVCDTIIESHLKFTLLRADCGTAFQDTRQVITFWRDKSQYLSSKKHMTVIR